MRPSYEARIVVVRRCRKSPDWLACNLWFITVVLTF